LISTNSLEELLNLEYNLTSEIKELDGSIQTLVYENYNKFISATDTIRSMKVNVESMETELHELLDSMNKIDSLANNV